MRKGALFDRSCAFASLFLCPLSHRDPLTPSPPQFFFSRATRRAFPPRRALLFLLVTDDFSLPASARPRPPAAMAAGPKFLAGAAPFSPLPLDLFPSRFEPGSPPRSSFFHPSPPPTPNFSNFYSGFFSPSATTTTPIRLSGFSLSISPPSFSLPFALLFNVHGRERRRQRRLRRRLGQQQLQPTSFPSLAAVRSAGVCFKRSLEQARGYDADCLCALYLARVMCTYVFDRVFIRTPQKSIAPSTLSLWLMSRAQCY